MSEALTSPVLPPERLDGLWRRLRHTPLRDVVRGRLTARFDLEREIARHGLPAPLARMIFDVARRTRLWRSEKIDVARELAAHFRDGLDAGASTELLSSRFGDLRSAARLIRTARIRCRPAWWRAWHWTALSLGAAALLIGMACIALVTRYLTTSPTISRDYVSEINAKSGEWAEGERGWPLYRAALIELSPFPTEVEVLLGNPQNTLESWDQADRRIFEAFLAEHETAMDLVHTGAGRPVFGALLCDPADEAFRVKVARMSPSLGTDKNRPLLAVLLPHLQEMRRLSWLLSCDARLAMADGDRQRLTTDIASLLGMSRQIYDESPFLIQDLVAFGVLHTGLDVLGEALADHPELLADGDLQRFSHLLAAVGDGGEVKLRMKGERMMLDDVFQRMYSDNGKGGGRFTPEGMQLLEDVGGTHGYLPNSNQNWTDVLARDAMGVALSAVIADREEMSGLAERLLNQMEEETAGPVGGWPAQTADDEIKALVADPLTKLRYAPLLLLLPGGLGVSQSVETVNQRMTALTAALALEDYRRRHGAWPDNWAPLVPDVLPSPPLDRITLKPLRYAIVDGRPLIYSCGPDGDDDGGIPCTAEEGILISAAHQRILGQPLRPEAQGDWILWP
jgi:hypothetical protein